MHFLISSSSSRPFYSLQVVHVRFEDKPLLAKHLMENVFNRVCCVPLELQSLETTAVVAQKNSDLQLQTLKLIHLYYNHFLNVPP